MTTMKNGQPTHQATYTALREMILCGDLMPGQAITIQGLATMLRTGATPAREAIRRLISEGALQFRDNRRVCIPVLTPMQVDELAIGRTALETELARRAIKIIQSSDIERLISIDISLDKAISQGNSRAYLWSNYQFHMAIYDLADAQILLQAVQGFWLRTSPSLRIMCGRLGTNMLPDMHKELLAALRTNDPDRAATALTMDIAQGMAAVREIANST